MKVLHHNCRFPAFRSHMDIDPNLSQTERAVYGLRGLIVQGKLKPGDRVLEQALVDAFGVSRTPARAAMQRISEEGLISLQPSGGYVVSSFTEDDVFDAISIRGTLEGMAARMAAEKGAPARVLKAMHECLEELDAVVGSSDVAGRQNDYVVLNDRLHDLICGAAQSPMVARALERLVAIPFSVNNSFTNVPASAEASVRDILRGAQEQHRNIVDAIENREGTRAQALMIEHSRSTWKSLNLMLPLPEPAALPGGLEAALRARRT